MQNSCVTTEDSKKRKWAVLISNVTIPPVIAVVMFSLINYSLLRGFPFFAITFITTLFTAIVPLSVLMIWETKTNAKFDLDIPAREDRNYPLLAAAASYLIGTVALGCCARTATYDRCHVWLFCRLVPPFLHQSVLENQHTHDEYCRIYDRARICLWQLGRADGIALTARYLEQGLPQKTYARAGDYGSHPRFCADRRYA